MYGNDWCGLEKVLTKACPMDAFRPVRENQTGWNAYMSLDWPRDRKEKATATLITGKDARSKAYRPSIQRFVGFVT